MPGDSAKVWRKRAQQARALAGQTRDPELPRKTFEKAFEYDALVAMLEKRRTDDPSRMTKLMRLLFGRLWRTTPT